MKLERFILDSRDERGISFLESVNNEKGLWGCDTVLRCIDACPKDVRPTDAIVGLRKTLVKEKDKALIRKRQTMKLTSSLVTRRTFLNTLFGGWLIAFCIRQLICPLEIRLPDTGQRT